MDFKEQLQLMDKLSPYADEIIRHYNDGVAEFEPTDAAVFNEYGNTILEIVGGAGITAKYENGKVYIDFD